jgi:hypothetical protein
MTARARAMGRSAGWTSPRPHPVVQLFDGSLGNVHQASSLGCFIAHVVPLCRGANKELAAKVTPARPPGRWLLRLVHDPDHKPRAAPYLNVLAIQYPLGSLDCLSIIGAFHRLISNEMSVSPHCERSVIWHATPVRSQTHHVSILGRLTRWVCSAPDLWKHIMPTSPGIIEVGGKVLAITSRPRLLPPAARTPHLDLRAGRVAPKVRAPAL